MLVTVFCAPRDRPETTFALDVSPELELRDFVALCALESGIPAGEIQISYAEQPLKDPTCALGKYGVKDGDVVVLRQTDRRPPPTQPAFPGLPQIDFRSITVPGTSTGQRGAVRPQQPAPPRPQQSLPRATQPSTPTASRGSTSQGLDDPALLQQMLLSNPHELSLLKERNPPLAEALLSGDLERFTKVLLEQQQDRAKREQERIRLMTADPFDLEAQAKIEEEIRQHNVEENMTIAMEEAPESFGQVVMLYINCKVNGHPVKAFVDSGAQMTIMSQACAERCNIMRLVDRRWAGIAKGVGTQKIIGRVHLAQVQIEGDFLPCSFSILEDQPMDMLLGLDMLKRHQCTIDLKKNVLLIGTTGTETRFLSEAELPECARLAYGAEGRDDTRPEEFADRELAEALQRSIQDSDPAEGQTTSRQLPPLTLPGTLDHQTSPSTSPSQSSLSAKPQILDRSQSAPATLRPVSPPGLGQQDPPLSSSPAGNTGVSPLQVQPLLPSSPPPHPPPSPPLPPAELLSGSTPPADVAPGSLKTDPGATEADADSPAPPHQDEDSLVQAMEQEEVEAHHTDPSQVEMECPPEPQPAASSEMDPPQAAPSLAAALMELHELLVSNTQAPPPDCSASSAQSQQLTPETDDMSPESCGPPSGTATVGVELSDIKSSHIAGGAPRGLGPKLTGEDGRPGEELVGGLSQHLDVSRKTEASEKSFFQPQLEPPPDQPEGPGSADPPQAPQPPQPSCLQAEPTSLSPLSMAVDSPEEPPSNSSPPPPDPPQPPTSGTPPPSRPPFIDQFPAEHIQQIQAAGFSAVEAAEALERAHGVVELALLVLLARSITVPT